MIILSHSGKQHSYHTAKSLYDIGLLESFNTSSYLTNEFIQDFVERKQNTYWSRRYIKGLPSNMVNANWRFEIPEVILRFLQGKSPAVQKAVYNRDVEFDRYMSKKLCKKRQDNIDLQFWGFQGSCYETLQKASQLGIISYCELATAHVVAAKRILGEEAALHKEWAHTIDNLSFPAYYEERLVNEPHLATKSIAASSFTQSTLLEVGIKEEDILFLPLGFDIDHIPYEENKHNSIKGRPLKLLYSGTVTQRKGIKYLLEAMSKLNGKDVELHIVGGIQGDDSALNNYKGLFHYHPPVSQMEMFQLYSEFDALVLPTIFEGFGLVIVEAMAAGLPVITTPHSIGPELIIDDQNGYIIPIRDIQSIVCAIEKLTNKTDGELFEMRKSARNSAVQYSWDAYALRLKKVLQEQGIL